MNVTTLHNVGATVYVVVSKPETARVVCDACASTGEVIISEVPYRCPKCGGRKIATGNTVHLVQSLLIDRIVADEDSNPCRIRYFGTREDGKHVVVPEADLFASKELAEASLPG